jgi:hypothetical protein
MTHIDREMVVVGGSRSSCSNNVLPWRCLAYIPRSALYIYRTQSTTTELYAMCSKTAGAKRFDRLNSRQLATPSAATGSHVKRPGFSGGSNL